MARKQRGKGRKAFKFSKLGPYLIKSARRAARRIIRNLHIIAIAAALLLAAKLAYNVLLTSDNFKVKSVEMLRIEGADKISDSGISFKVEGGVNIFRADLKKYKRDIERAHPEFKNVRINRVLPDKLLVYFEKRRPCCQVKSEKYYLVSSDAVVLPEPSYHPAKGLIVITGIFINENNLPFDRRLQTKAMSTALKLIRQIEETAFNKKYQVSTLDVADEFNPSIYLENGIQIKIDIRNFKERQRVLNQVLADLKAKGLRPKSIDLRFDDVVVTPR